MGGTECTMLRGRSARRKANLRCGVLLASAVFVGWPPRTVAAPVVAPKTEAAASPTLRHHHPPKAAYVVLGLAGVGVVAGAVFGFKALSAKRSFDQGDRTAERIETIEQNALYADMAFGAALTLGVMGTVVWFTHQDDDPGALGRSTDGAAVVVTPLAYSSGAGVTALVRF